MTPPHQDTQATFAAALVDEWVRGGLRHAVVCPGSRSTPLALAFAAHEDIDVQVHHDERSGGFLALGMALAGGRPVAVLVTSGTAAAELHPAIVEAHHAGVPLLVCTADRPPELRDVGAPQTIDQNRLYGGAVRWYSDPGVADDAVRDRWRAWAARALAETSGVVPGPVHVNLPFREPLVGTAGSLPPGRPADGPWVRADRGEVFHLQDDLDIFYLSGRRGVIVAGGGSGRGSDVIRLAQGLGWPVVADPRADTWQPSDVHVAHLDAILRSERARAGLRPDAVLRLGTPPASRVVNEWVAASGAEEIVVPGATWLDPAGTACLVVGGDVAQVVAELARDAHVASRDRPPGWLGNWRAAGDAAASALGEAWGAVPVPNEPAVASETVAGLPDDAWLVVSSSMPIRDVERYATPRSGLHVVANRGANGIDGVVSTAVGVAAASSAPTGLMIGDLAFLHDSNGLLGIAYRDVDLVCVVVDNDGGGIFGFLPQARTLDEPRFEQLFGTPHGLDLVALAQAYGVAARLVDDDIAGAVKAAAAAGGVHVLVVRTNRTTNVDVHQLLDTTIATAVDHALGKLS